jgi:DoxX-like family
MPLVPIVIVSALCPARSSPPPPSASRLVAGLPVAPLGVAAAAGLALLMIGAVIFHVRAHDPAARIAGPAIAGLIAVAAVIVRAASA